MIHKKFNLMFLASSVVVIILSLYINFLSTTPKTYNTRADVGPCTYNTPNLNLAEFNLMLPTGNAENPTEIFQPQLSRYKDANFYPSSDCNIIYFRAPVNGVTSSGSPHPRSELRETSNNGTVRIKWSNRTGVHNMETTHIITHLPNKEKAIVVAQVHNTAYDAVVIRYDQKAYADYPNPTKKFRLFVNTEGDGTHTLTENYTLGTPFSIKFEARDSKVNVYFNNSSSPLYTYNRPLDTAFFKAGAYVQSNCSKEASGDCNTNNYGEAAITSIRISHSNTNILPSSPTPTRTPTPSKTPTPTKVRTPTPTPPPSTTKFQIRSQVQLNSNTGQYFQSGTNCTGYPTLSDGSPVTFNIDSVENPGNISYRYYTNCDSLSLGTPYATTGVIPPARRKLWISLPIGYVCQSWEIYKTPTGSTNGTKLLTGAGCIITDYNFTLLPGYDYLVKYIIKKP